ncbi:helix-turn-helix transcriptional regulator [Corynebacterium renale]|uniref:Putative DNA-binding transcriptional regulator YafY n=1 Tax=Corynebacterium renale TaxID=1724 RepID=A0A2A9DPP3_9CORY|nr:WYL domain-containing protein [Corynebacterium renale]PFG28727.1 putative DNA-binding transcriptional regulator YafY [Corynebacterium renale]SQI26026.1 transcriptional regulator [Corynebacterium renale]
MAAEQTTPQENPRDKTDRILQLMFVLIDSARSGHPFLSITDLRSKIRDYSGKSVDAARHMLNRDVEAIARMGMPLERTTFPDGSFGYRLNSQRYELPEIDFTPEEAAVLGLAGDLGRRTELAAFARSGWSKLAAGGLDRDLSDSTHEIFYQVDDFSSVTPQVWKPIIHAVAKKVTVTFDYTPSPAATPQPRRMDPWAVVPLNNRIYLLGFDLDKNAGRAFRIVKISRVIRTDRPITHPHPADLSATELVKESLQRNRTLIDATVRIFTGTSQALRNAGEVSASEDGLDTITLHDVDREWLVRTVASYGAQARVVSPEDVVSEVQELIQKAVN